MGMARLDSDTAPAGPPPGRTAIRAPLLLVFLVLEGHLDLGAIRHDPAVAELHVKIGDLCDTQLSQRRRRPFHGSRSGLLPRLGTGSDQLDDLVDALCHAILPVDTA